MDKDKTNNIHDITQVHKHSVYTFIYRKLQIVSHLLISKIEIVEAYCEGELRLQSHTQKRPN